MRWKTIEFPPEPQENDTRVVSRFLLFPCSLEGITRWWEWAKINQILRSEGRYVITNYGGAWQERLRWKNVSWADASKE